jgi:hypothetical protein
MRRTLTTATTVLLVALTTAPALAAPPPGSYGECVQLLQAITAATLDSPFDTDSSLGDAISDGFFGNEPNLLNTNTNLDLGPDEVSPGTQAGTVEASLSPGPGTIGGGFLTWGAIKQAGGFGSVYSICH